MPVVTGVKHARTRSFGALCRRLVPVAVLSLVLGGSAAVGTTSAVPWSDGATASAVVSSLRWDWLGVYQFRGAFSKCLDVENRTNLDGTSVRLWTCNNTVAQKWTVAANQAIHVFSAADPGSNTDDRRDYQVTRCLAVTNGTGSAQVQIKDCAATNGRAVANQRWYFVDNGDGTAQIRNQRGNDQQGNDLCLGTTAIVQNDPTLLTMATCNSANPKQAWKLEAYGTPPIVQA